MTKKMWRVLVIYDATRVNYRGKTVHASRIPDDIYFVEAEDKAGAKDAVAALNPQPLGYDESNWALDTEIRVLNNWDDWKVKDAIEWLNGKQFAEYCRQQGFNGFIKLED